MNIKVYAADPIVGTIKPPKGVQTEVATTAVYLSRFIIAFVVVAGIWALWQFLSAGLAYISSNGDKGKIQLATAKLNMAIIGLVVVAASFIIAGILGWALFGSATAILSPSIETI